MVPDRRGKIAAHKKAFRFKNKTIAIRTQINRGIPSSEPPVIMDRVVDAKVVPSNFLAYHPSIEGIGYSITHIPTGTEITVKFSEQEARNLIESIDGNDWDFHTPTRKLRKQLRKNIVRLYQVTPRPFTKKDYKTGDIWQIMAVDVGTVGSLFRQDVVPVVGYDLDSDKWLIVPSRSGRPKIFLSDASSPGHIAVLSSRRPFGRKVGNVFVSLDTLDSITVLAHGVGGRIETGETWNEYVAAIYGGATIYVEGICPPDELVIFSDNDVITHPNPEPVDFREYVSLSSKDIRKWQRDQ